MFFKLDSGQLNGFDTQLAPDVHTFKTGSLSVLRALASRRGWVRAISAAVHQILSPDPDAYGLVEGNLTRKRIRLPQVFGNRAIFAVYRHIKAAQAGLLKQALEVELQAEPPACTIIFNGSNYPESVLSVVSATLPRVFVEGGFFPGTLQIDPKGLNGGNTVPRDVSFYTEGADHAAQGLPQKVNNRASKRQFEEVPLQPGFVFVPFQVPSDMQVTLYSTWVRDMEQFLDVIIAAAEDNPDDVFVIKEHPSFKRSVIGLRPEHPRVVFANGNVTSELLAQARAVVTLNSTVGIEALLHEAPVITLGEACYNIDGLVQHAPDPEAFNAALRNREWRPDETLRRQFLGYLWNTYLVHGRYDALPEDLAQQLQSRAGQDIIS